MKNGFNIVWSNEAKLNLSRIIDYFETTWSEKELRIFFQRLEKTLQYETSEFRLKRNE